jgi:tetratricopeptide (TPR) repeat protein/tRNA A-37 threonylcarbamoyl transferase component Bud32
MLFTCSQGHQWEASIRQGSDPVTVEPPVCPVCGARSVDGLSTLTSVPLGELPPLPRPVGPRPATDKPAPARLPVLPGYDVLEPIGEGGMGIVYKARQLHLNRIVAVKMLLRDRVHRTEELIRFHTEAEAAARLQHPNIVQIFEVGEADGQPFLVLEFIDGQSLERRLRQAPLPPREAAGLVQTVARALHHAHERNIVHRDLKPSNVLLDAAGTPRIADFGLARKLEDTEGLTPSGAVLGTPSYMAPEQAQGNTRSVGPLADLYACGALLYDLLTGRPPFKADTVVDTLLQVIHDEPVRPSRLQPKVPHDLETIVLTCLRKEPHKRYASAEALADDLGRFLDGKPIRARPVGLVERAVRWARRQPAQAALVAVVACGILLLLGAGLWYADHERRRAEEAQLQRDIAEQESDRAVRAEQKAKQLLADSYASTAQLAMRRGDWRTALRYLEKALAEGHSAPTGLRLERVRALAAVGEIPTAVADLEALSRLPGLGQRERALVLLWQGDIALSRSSSHADKALEVVAQAVRLGLPEADHAYARGLLAPTSREAVQHLEKALKIEPFHHRANGVLGFLLLSLGQLAEARDRVAFAESAFPDDPTFTLLHASLFALEDRMAGARMLLEQARPRMSKSRQATARLQVEMLNQLYQMNDTIDDPAAPRGKVGNSITALLWRLPEGIAKESLESTDFLLVLPPTVVRAYKKAATATLQVFVKEKMSDQNRAAFTEALRIHQEGLLHYLHGFSLFQCDHFAEAEQAFLAAARTPAVVPIRQHALFRAALCAWTLARERTEKSKELRQRALQHTRDLVALGRVRVFWAFYLTVIARDMNEVDLARTIIADWERQAAKDDVRPLLQKAQVELLGGAYGRARAVANRILKIDPSNEQAARYRGLAIQGIRNQAEALKMPPKGQEGGDANPW